MSKNTYVRTALGLCAVLVFLVPLSALAMFAGWTARSLERAIDNAAERIEDWVTDDEEAE